MLVTEKVRNPLRFQGQYFDHETGLHYNRHRYYDPQIGRYISKDPIGLAGGLNPYAYAPNPTGWVDPRGLDGIRWGEVASNGIDFLGSCVAGTFAGTILLAAPTGVTQAVGAAVATKSIYSCGTTSYNLTRYFSNDKSYDIPSQYKTLPRAMAAQISCSKTAQNVADVTELSLDLMSGRITTGFVRINPGYDMVPGYLSTEVATVIHRPATVSDELTSSARKFTGAMAGLQSASSIKGSADQIKNNSEDCK
jgi:RHS repeat-associated protein